MLEIILLQFQLFREKKIYRNADTDKLQIITEAKGKAVSIAELTAPTAPQWAPKGKTYIGSSANLSLRMKEYYSFRTYKQKKF